MRKAIFTNGEFYHVYNRGVDKRSIFKNEHDISRFLQSMKEFNSVDPIGSIYENSYKSNQLGGRTAKSKILPEMEKIVNLICYCLNYNHYHFILQQVHDGGVSEFMKRLGGGYAWYFNNKYERSGSLFQGKFKAIHINSNEYLIHLSAYVNLNSRVHKSEKQIDIAEDSRSSWNEYVGESKGNLCEKDIILDQFDDRMSYKKFALSSLQDIKTKRKEELGSLLIE